MRRSKTSAPCARRVSGARPTQAGAAAHQVAANKLLHALLVVRRRRAQAHSAQARANLSQNGHQVEHRQVLRTSEARERGGTRCRKAQRSPGRCSATHRGAAGHGAQAPLPEHEARRFGVAEHQLVLQPRVHSGAQDRHRRLRKRGGDMVRACLRGAHNCFASAARRQDRSAQAVLSSDAACQDEERAARRGRGRRRRSPCASRAAHLEAVGPFLPQIPLVVLRSTCARGAGSRQQRSARPRRQAVPEMQSRQASTRRPTRRARGRRSAPRLS